MSYCKYCGKEIEIGARFCQECGTKVEEKTDNDVEVKIQMEYNKETSLKEEETDATALPEELQVVYEGIIHKCPNCGKVLKAFETVCSECGFELRSVISRSAVAEFAKKVQQIEDLRVHNEWATPTKEKELTNTDKQKIALIRSFAIPNTKEDLYEFMILAGANIDIEVMVEYAKNEPARAETDAWVAQFEQAYKKAQLMFYDDPGLAAFEHIYKEKIVEAKKQRKKKERLSDIFGYTVLIALAVIFIGVIVLVVDGICVGVKDNHLEKKLKQVYIHVEEENYDLAYIEAASLIYAGSDSKKSKKTEEKWNQIREQMLDILEKNMKSEQEE